MAKRKTSLIRSPDFKTVYAVGAIGTWTPYDFRINFYSEKVIEEDDEAYVNDTQIILSPKATREFAQWLMQNISDYEATYGKPLPSESDQDGDEADAFKSDLRNDLTNDIKNSLRDELKIDLRKYFKKNLQDDLKKNLKMFQTPELKKDLKKDLKQDLHKDIKPELRKDLKRVLKADLKQDLREDIKKDIREEIKRDLHGTPSTTKLKTKSKARVEGVKGTTQGRKRGKINATNRKK